MSRQKKSSADAEPVAAAPNGTPAAVVALGASAGGLEALQAFFGALNAESGAAFVVIQHQKSDAASLLTDILGRSASLPVVEASAGMRLVAEHVYVLPPGHGLTLERGTLRPAPDVTTSMMPIDRFFRALALDQAERAVGIVLSGTASDGTSGLKAIKEQGGLVIAQEPATAQQEAMPRSAIEMGLVDAVLAPADMPELVGRYARGLATSRLMAEGPLQRILAQIRAQTHHDFRQYKPGTLIRRIHRRMGLKSKESLDAYEALLHRDRDELMNLHQDLLIGVTRFFRDSEAFAALTECALRPLVLAHDPGEPLRIWVPACSTGEEAYSIAMALSEVADQLARRVSFKIFATDIDKQALDVARRGQYPQAIAAEVSDSRLARFFMPTATGYQVQDDLRESIVFAEQNLTSDPAFSKLDLISCRNLLIYLEPGLQRKVMGLFHFALKPGGYLFLGTSETAGGQETLFKPVSKKWRVYRRAEGRYTGDYPAVTRGASRPEHAGPAEAVRKAPVNMASLVQQELLAAFTPAAVLVNDAFEALYFHGEVGGFLTFPAGKTTFELPAMCPLGMRSKLRRALAEARATQAIQRIEGIWGEADEAVEVTVKPMTAGGGELYLLTFERIKATVAEVTREGHEIGRIEHLEAELKLAQDELKSTHEEMESSTEELKAANEEMTSINEELQSTNEELETTKEELQSLNEELTTVNQQLQEKIVELEDANNDLINFLASTDTATIFLDLQLRIKRFTPVTRKLLNVLPADVGRPLIDLAQKVDDKTLLSDVALVIENLAPIEKEVQTAGHTWFLRRILPYRTKDNRIAGVVITFTDITHLKANESAKARMVLQRHYEELQAQAARLTEANERLTELERLKDDFLSAASHELRTPLSSILGFGEFLEDGLAGPLNAEQQAFVQEIQQGARRLRRLVDDLLDFARMEAGSFKLDLREAELGLLTKGVLTSLGPQVRQGGLALKAVLPAGPILAMVDPDRVEQVLINLLSNAIKFTPKGGAITVSLAADDAEVKWAVSDTGIGIRAEDMARLFQKFFQVDSSSTREHGGTGLGLAISRSFVEAHGGRIGVSSQPGTGATFWFTLPLHPASPLAGPAPEA